MRDEFEFHGKGVFAPDSLHSQQDAAFFTDEMTVEALPRDNEERRAWKSTWQNSGWLCNNPLVCSVSFLEMCRMCQLSSVVDLICAQNPGLHSSTILE